MAGSLHALQWLDFAVGGIPGDNLGALNVNQLEGAISGRWLRVRIVVAACIELLISSAPAKQPMVGTSIRASSTAESLSQ